MLSEECKARFRRPFDMSGDDVREWAMKKGPKALVDWFINSSTMGKDHPDVINAQENREELEKFCAGLLGLM
jgi:hypothetical protein